MGIACDNCKYFVVTEDMYCMKVKEYFVNGFEAKRLSETCGEKMKKLNFGCGINKREGYDNIDFENFDFNKFPYPIKDNIYDKILVRDVLEHMQYPVKTLEELHRICAPDGVIKIITPYYNSAGAFGSMEHYHYFNRNSFMVFDSEFKGNRCSKSRFIVNVKLIPTRLGKCIPSFIREKISFVIGEVYNSIEVEMWPIK